MITIPFCFLRSIKSLAPVSIIACFILLIAGKWKPFVRLNFLVSVIAKFSFQTQIDRPELHQDLPLFEPTGTLMFFGVAVFDFEGNGLVINVMTSMKEPEKFDSILRGVVVFYIGLLASFSALIYYVSRHILSPEACIASKIDSQTHNFIFSLSATKSRILFL